MTLPRCPRRVCSALALAAAIFATAACPAGRGEGWVVGSLFVENCKEGENFDAQGNYDLEADYFAGDPLFDSADSAQAKNRLFVRIQNTSNQVSETNGLALQFQDLGVAAQAFAEGRVLPITDDSLLPPNNNVNTAVRMRLQLYTRCPDNKAPLNAIGWPLSMQPGGPTSRSGDCMRASATATPSCPTLTAAQRSELDAICDEPDFDLRDSRARMEAILGSGTDPACLYFCQLGGIQRGADPETLRGYRMDYNETIAALFVSKLVDGRAIRLGRCAQGWGQISGRFRFTLVRSRAAQPFP